MNNSDKTNKNKISSFYNDEAWGFKNQPHDTYRNQRKYVQSLGNKWAMENFEATKPYFC